MIFNPLFNRLSAPSSKLVLSSLFLIFLLLSSCTQQIINTNAIVLTKEQQLQLSTIPQKWDLKGRLSIIHNDENWHAHFHWIKKNSQFTLRFTGPLGETHLLLEQKLRKTKLGQIKQNTLTLGGKTYTSVGSMNQLLLAHTGMGIPVKSLQYWIFARYNPAQPYQINALSAEAEFSNNIKELLQEDWQIQFSRYKKGQSKAYPAKIIAKDGEYKIKVFIRSRNSI